MASTISAHLSSLLSQRLAGKVALVTGGANGIGESIVRSFLRHGAKVCCADIQDEKGRRLCETLRHGGDDVSYFHCDVSVEEEVKQAVDDTVSRFGTLDIMVNNAGRIDPPRKDIRDAQIWEFDQIYSVNVRGTFSGMKHAARVMIPAKKGAIVSIASVAGVIGGTGTHAYTAAKYAVVGLTKSVAAELGKHGIRVNSVSPYAMMTEMTLMLLPEEMRGDEVAVAGLRDVFAGAANLKGVELSAEDVANAVVFLGSDDGRYVSGANLLVDGGFSSVNHTFESSLRNATMSTNQ